MRASFEETCNEKVGAKQKHQKWLYNKKIHCQQYKPGDLAWLLNPNVPKGKAKEFKNPWTGPYKVTDRLSAVPYKIQNTLNHHFSVAHFDRLKLCSPNICIPRVGQQIYEQAKWSDLKVLPNTLYEQCKCDFCRRPGHVEDDCRQKKREAGEQNRDIHCYHCKNYDHGLRECQERVAMLCKEQAVKSKSSGATMYKKGIVCGRS